MVLGKLGGENYLQDKIYTKPKGESNSNVHQWMNQQMWYINKIEYYSAIKRSEVLTNTTRQMSLENKWKKPDSNVTYGMIPFIWSIQDR